MPRRDDFDDRPRRRDDNRDDDDRLRRRPVPSGSNKTIIIVVVAVLGLLLVGCGGGVVALLVYSTAKVREATVRVKDSNNLKVLGLALHTHHDATGAIAGPFAIGTTGAVNPGLSMRVGILPYMEQDAVYRMIDRDQAWDSPRNAAATSQPIRDLQSPWSPTAGNATPYRAFVGGGALFSADGKPFKLGEVPDGISNTILLVHATETVPWAEPRELPYSRATPLPKLGPANGPGGYNVLMADGSVRYLRNTPEPILRLLIEKADGQVIPPFE